MLLGGLAAGYWARTHPSACPYALRFVLRFPRRALARERLLEILAPGPGERVLEIGPGTGYYSLAVAPALDGGTLDTLDISQEFLDNVLRKAGERGIENITATRGDARTLPYGDESFNAAFLVRARGGRRDEYALPRVSVYSGDGPLRLRAKTSRFMRALPRR